MSANWPELILASASPRRLDLLQQAGFSVIVQPVDVDEESLLAPNASETALLRAQAKAEVSDHSKEWVVAADTVVESPDGELLDKPLSVEEARSHLEKIWGTTHFVHSAVVLRLDQEIHSHLASAQVSLKSPNLQEREIYLATGESLGKAGGLCIQGHGVKFVEKIEGEEAVVLGLPLNWVINFFNTLK